jgi:hypothetical protein
VPEYRIYTLTDGGKIDGPSRAVICDDDQDAIKLAKRWLDGHDLQVWQGARLVNRLKRASSPWA